MNVNNRQIASIPILVFSSFVFLFGALSLVVPSGYNYGALLLLLSSVGYLFVRAFSTLQTGSVLQACDGYLILMLSSYFLLGCAFNFFQHLPVNSYDNLIRFILVIPVLLLLLRFPVRQDFLWLGLAAGAIGAAVLAAWDLLIQREWRASGHTNAIQFGDIAILFSCLLLPVLAARKEKKVIYNIVIMSGIIGGIFASLLSGARGGWLALLMTLLWLYVAFGFYKNQKKTAIIIAALLVAIAVLYQFPQQGLLQSRVNDGLHDLHQYQLNHDVSTSIGSRLHMWQRALEMISLHPLQGWGTQERVVQYLDAMGTHDPVLAAFNHVHNDFLDAMVKRGLIGGVMLISLYIIPVILFYQQLKTVSGADRIAPVAGIGLVVCVATFGLTQTFFSHASGCMMYLFILVILWAQTRTQNVTYKKNATAHNYPLNSLREGNV